MKKLGKLSINIDKIIKNEELVNLRGGDYGYGECRFLICADGDYHTLCDYCIDPWADPTAVCTETCSGFYWAIVFEGSQMCGC